MIQLKEITKIKCKLSLALIDKYKANRKNIYQSVKK